jgi:hypothetical protein
LKNQWFFVALDLGFGEQLNAHLGRQKLLTVIVERQRKPMDWPRLLAYITGTVDQELLTRNEYLIAENRILKNQIKGRLLLSDPEKKDTCRNRPSARPQST